MVGARYFRHACITGIGDDFKEFFDPTAPNRCNNPKLSKMGA